MFTSAVEDGIRKCDNLISIFFNYIFLLQFDPHTKKDAFLF